MGVAVHALGITQIVAWGTTLYALAVLGKPIMAETGWSSTVVFGGLTLGLLISGVISSWVGRVFADLPSFARRSRRGSGTGSRPTLGSMVQKG